MKTIRVGLVGSQFVSTIHLEALRSVPATEVVAVASATEAHARAFAERHGIPRWFTDYRKMYELPDLDLVVAMTCGNYAKSGQEQGRVNFTLLAAVVLPLLT